MARILIIAGSDGARRRLRRAVEEAGDEAVEEAVEEAGDEAGGHAVVADVVDGSVRAYLARRGGKEPDLLLLDAALADGVREELTGHWHRVSAIVAGPPFDRGLAAAIGLALRFGRRG